MSLGPTFRPSRSYRVFQWLNVIVMIGLTATMLVPFINTLALSFSTPRNSMQPGIVLWPNPFSLSGYEVLFKQIDILHPLLNNTYVAVMGTLLHVLLSALTAYTLVRRPFPGRRIFVILLMVFLKDPMQQVDALLAAHSLANVQGIGKILLLFAAIGAVEWLTMARIVRAQIMSVKKMEFIEAARSLGYSHTRIIFRHMIPNILGPVIVYTTLTIPAVMLLESFLSFLGLGVDAPMSSWGTLIKDGAEKMEEFPWLLVFPGAVFSLTLFSLNFLGDGLRDALDVRASKD